MLQRAQTERSAEESAGPEIDFDPVATVDGQPTVETRSPRYEILEQLTESSQRAGLVLRVYDRRLGREVAIKRICSTEAVSPEVREQLLAKARTIARLNHSGIVHVHEIDEDPEGLFMVMEYIVGQNLGTLLQSRGNLSPERTIEIARQVCDAIKAIHSQGIVHGAISPADVLFGSQGTVKLVGFRFAQLNQQAGRSSTQDPSSSLAYTPPEQRQGAAPPDNRCDIYSIGAVMYAMATGECPDVVRPEKIPPELRRCILRALCESPDRRHASVDELIQDLTSIPVDELPGLIQRADVMFTAGDLEPALALYHKAVCCAPQNTWARQQCGLIEARLQIVQTARRETLQAPTTGHWERALRAWQRVLESMPDHAEGREQLAHIRAEICSRRLGPAIESARQALEEADYDRAHEFCRLALEMSPDHTEVRILQKKLAEAAAKNTRATLVAATQAYRSKDYTKAVTAIQEAISLLPPDNSHHQRLQNLLAECRFAEIMDQCDQHLNHQRLDQARQVLWIARELATEKPALLARVQKRRDRLARAEAAAARTADKAARRADLRFWMVRGLIVLAIVTGAVVFSIYVNHDLRRPLPGATKKISSLLDVAPGRRFQARSGSPFDPPNNPKNSSPWAAELRMLVWSPSTGGFGRRMNRSGEQMFRTAGS